MTRRGVMGLFVLGAAISLAGCGERAEVRTKVSIEVVTPQGVRAGSSVWSWTLSKAGVALASPYDGRFRGEAVAVDLPNGRTLFALVKDQEMLAERQFRDLKPEGPEDRVADIRAIAKQVGAQRRLGCLPRPDENYSAIYDCPLLVTFRDIRDPKSVERVDPAALDKSFGPGVTLRRITVAVTDEPVTTGIEKRLGWLREVGRKRGSLIPNPPALLKDTTPIQLVASTDFSTELYK